jgi:hypothetical protein
MIPPWRSFFFFARLLITGAVGRGVLAWERRGEKKEQIRQRKNESLLRSGEP